MKQLWHKEVKDIHVNKKWKVQEYSPTEDIIATNIDHLTTTKLDANDFEYGFLGLDDPLAVEIVSYVLNQRNNWRNFRKLKSTDNFIYGTWVHEVLGVKIPLWLKKYGDLYGFLRTPRGITETGDGSKAMFLENPMYPDSFADRIYAVRIIPFVAELVALRGWLETYIDIYSLDTPNPLERHKESMKCIKLWYEMIGDSHQDPAFLSGTDKEIQYRFLGMAIKHYCYKHRLVPTVYRTSDNVFKESLVLVSIGDLYWAEMKFTLLSTQPLAVCQYVNCGKYFHRTRDNQKYCPEKIYPDRNCQTRAKNQRSYYKKRK